MKTITDYLIKKKQAIISIGRYDIKFELKGRFLSMEFDGLRYVRNAYSGDVCEYFQEAFENETGQEMRFCDECGKPFDAGYTTDDGGWYCCEECFEPAMNRDYGSNWRVTDDVGENGGYYEYLTDKGEWEDIGIYWTEWN